MKRTKLFNLRLREVSLVDDPANPHARVLLHKRRDEGGDGHQSRPGSEGDDMNPELEKKVGTLESGLADLSKRTDTAVALMLMPDPQRLHFAGLTKQEDRDAFLKLDPAARGKAVKDAKKTPPTSAADSEDEDEEDPKDETMTKGGVTIRKSKVGAELFELLKAQETENARLAKKADDATAAVAKANDAAELVRLEKRAEEEFPFVAGTPAEKALVLKGIDAMPKEQRESMLSTLKASNAAIEMATKTAGVTTRPAEGSALHQLDALAKGMVTKAAGALSYAKAYSLAMEQNPHLYEQSEKDRKAHLRLVS